MKSRFLLSCLLVGMLAAGAYAIPISYISATTVPVTYTAPSGSIDGKMVVNGTQPVLIHRLDTSQEVLLNTHFLIETYLDQDLSVGGIAKGIFMGGMLSIEDTSGNPYLEGRLVDLTLVEVFNDLGVLGATGTFMAERGSLLQDFGEETGVIYQIVFSINPKKISDLSQSFTGYSNTSIAPIYISVPPIPEPVSITLLTLGLAGLALFRRRH